MSFDIFMQGFKDGDAATGDGDAAMAVLAPLITDRREGFLRIITDDGTAEVYGSDPSRGFTFTHASGRLVWDVMFEVARAAGFVIMPLGCGTCVVDAAVIAELPVGVPEPIVVVASGAELLARVESS